MSKKILITRRIPDIGIKMLEAKGYELDISPKKRNLTRRELLGTLKDKPYDAVLCLLTDAINKEIFDIAPTVKIFANYAVGYNNIDVEEAKKRDVTITNTPGSFSFSIAEHTIALMLALTTRLVEGDEYIRRGKYKGWAPMEFMGTDMRGKVVGLLGVGRIGSEVAHMVSKGFGAKVIYYDVARNEQLEKDEVVVFRPTVEEVLKEADIVSIHVPLLDSTHHLINAARLKMMKPTAYLINTSRGPVVDEVALVKALQHKVIRGAGLDVFEFEPKLARGLAKLPNVVLTPHIASARENARNEMATLAAQSIIDVFEGRVPKNKVTK